MVNQKIINKSFIIFGKILIYSHSTSLKIPSFLKVVIEDEKKKTCLEQVERQSMGKKH